MFASNVDGGLFIRIRLMTAGNAVELCLLGAIGKQLIPVSPLEFHRACPVSGWSCRCGTSNSRNGRRRGAGGLRPHQAQLSSCHRLPVVGYVRAPHRNLSRGHDRTPSRFVRYRPSFTDQVSGEVLTSTQPVRPLQLKRSTHCGTSAARMAAVEKMSEVQSNRSLVRMTVITRKTLVVLFQLASDDHGGKLERVIPCWQFD